MRLRTSIVSVAVVLFTALALAQQRFTIDDVLSAPFSSELLTANGRAAWIVNEEGARNIWVAAAPDWKARSLTSYKGDEGIDLGDVHFTPDGESVVFVRGGDLEMEGDPINARHSSEKPEQAIWIAEFRDGALRKVAEGSSPSISPRGHRIVFIGKKQLMSIAIDPAAKPETLIAAEGVRSTLRFSPDGTRLAFVSRRREHSFIGVYDFAGKTTRYLDPGIDRDSSPAWSPDSTRVAFIRQPGTQDIRIFASERAGVPWSIRIADVATGKGREVWRADRGDGSVYREIVADDQLVWAAGDRIVFPWEKDGWTHLYSVPAGGGGAQLLTPGEFEVEHVALSPDRREAIYSSNQGDIDRRHVWRVPVDGSRSPAAVTSGRGNEWTARFAGAKDIIVLRSDARRPSTAAILTNGSAPKDLTPLPATFPLAQLVEPQQVVFTSTDGLQIHGQLFLPAARAGRHPAAVFFHGGSQRQMLLGWHYMQYYSNAYAMNQYLASRGYVVLSVNYRSGIGYGMRFREAENYGARGASEVNDVIGAALYLRSRPDVDPARIGAWGGSYGGYLTAFALAKASNLYAAGVDLHGVHDWNNEIRHWVPSYDPAAHPEQARLAWQSSPMAYVDTWRSPVLLIHGDDDRNVPFNETIHLVEELRKHDVDVEQLVFPDEIHDFILHQSWAAAYKAAADFFDRKMGANAP